MQTQIDGVGIGKLDLGSFVLTTARDQWQAVTIWFREEQWTESKSERPKYRPDGW